MKSSKIIEILKDIMSQLNCTAEEAFDAVLEKHYVSQAQYDNILKTFK